MTPAVVPMSAAETAALRQLPAADDGLGALFTDRGNLPLESIEADVSLTGLLARTTLTQGFRNQHDVPLEATYIFPLPDRAAVVAMRMTADDRTVEADLRPRDQARQEYQQAIEKGQRASIAEQERPDVFTMRVGNIQPGERVSVTLTLVGPLPYEDGEATYRLPLVVAPRYIPGQPIDQASTGPGPGYSPDTDAVPDASRITPPVLLPGFPSPVRLSIDVHIDPAGLELGEVRSSLHAVTREVDRLRIEPGERPDRDFVLRLRYGQAGRPNHTLELAPDEPGDEGTFRLTVLPPRDQAPARPRDLVLLLDRSGSMGGWKMVAARRAAARIVDTLTPADRFAVLAFDHQMDRPPALPAGLVEATDRNRYRAVEHLSRMDARGGTEMLRPLLEGLGLLTDASRDRVLVLVTDGQVGNEDQILARTKDGIAGVRVHTVGIDRAVNAGFLGRLAAAGRGRCELVESEDRLDTAMESINRRIGAPAVHSLALAAGTLAIIDGTVSPRRLPDLFPGVPLVVTGRYRITDVDSPTVTVTGRTRSGQDWSLQVTGAASAPSVLAPVWARAHLRDLEDHYASEPSQELEQAITSTSLRFRVLSRFTAWLAIDTRVVNEGGEMRRVVQPVEPASGWDMLAVESAGPSAALAMLPPEGPPPSRTGATSAAQPSLRFSRAAFLTGAADLEAGGAGHLLPSGTGAAVHGVRRMGPLAGEPSQPPEDLASRLAAEAGRLRAAAGEPEYERRELLADLGTRLQAILRELPAADEPAALRALVEQLADDAPLRLQPEAFEDLWRRTLAVLDELAATAADEKGRRRVQR